jgi:uncharacterized protein YceK
MNLYLLNLRQRRWQAGRRRAGVIATWLPTPSQIAQKGSLLFLVLVQGCGTLISHSDLSARALSPGAGRLYRGVQYDGKYLDGAFGLAVMCDVPFSFVADTLMIPFDMRSHYPVEQPSNQVER